MCQSRTENGKYAGADGVRCAACGRKVAPDQIASHYEHNAGGEDICLACHREIILSDRELHCPGCRSHCVTGRGNRGRRGELR